MVMLKLYFQMQQRPATDFAIPRRLIDTKPDEAARVFQTTGVDLRGADQLCFDRVSVTENECHEIFQKLRAEIQRITSR